MGTLLSLLILLATTAPSKPTEPLYRSGSTTSPVVIDGKLDELSWQNAPWTGDFVPIQGDHAPGPKFRTRAKVLWDDRALYIAAEIEETDIRAEMKNRDDKLYRENAFEIFIDADGDGKDYLEIEINAINTIFDLIMTKPYRAGGRADAAFSVPGLSSAIGIDGTLNDPSDRDRAWMVELAIPFECLPKPKAGERWRVNFARVQHDPPGGPATFFTWSPHGKVDMHLPDRFGWVEFVTSDRK